MLQHYKTLQTLPTAQPFLEEERKIFEELETNSSKKYSVLRIKKYEARFIETIHKTVKIETEKRAKATIILFFIENNFSFLSVDTVLFFILSP